ncbi:hypothetical protein M011DRAFT_478313 [Sporormia fimetaria CBS 119925]|uniref:Uncharacterized protein n=1 Tax=Sporormia fimetaria CBS 119925 TaxID=1340428 RepID=A0A6A6V9F1_9PLEO|nr:hypothetical protein M011DRAFT_478313 [Sporormia fimetaria CBS 119925]
MISSTSFLLLSTIVGHGFASAIPPSNVARLESRAPGDSMAEPIFIEIDCSGGPAVCNADCFTILCLAGPNPVQYDAEHAGEHRRESGYRIFRDNEEMRLERGVDIPDSILDETGRSGEESIMANTAQGGEGEILYPTRTNENEQIGRMLQGQLSHHHITDGQWYFKQFRNYPAGSAPYCDALQQAPPDHSVCTRRGKKKTDPAWTAVIKSALRGARNMILFHMINVDAGDRWTGKPWANSKREVPIIEAEKAE